MPKAKKEQIKSHKLYHGTSEIRAKESCISGLFPYELKDMDYYGVPRRIHASNTNGVCLTSSSPGLMAFETSSHKERWGIIEIDASYLSPELLVPYEGFLLERVKARVVSEEDRFKKISQIRQSLSSNHKKWRESLDDYGMCFYQGNIPLESISKVIIYDPQSNPIITKAIISCSLIGNKLYRSSFKRQKMLTRWLSGEHVTPEEWLGTTVYSKLEHSDKERISKALINKHGLDIFYSANPVGKKILWW